MRRALATGVGLVLLIAMPAVGQSPGRDTETSRLSGKERRSSNVIGALVSFRNGQQTGRVVDLVIDDNGGIASAVVRSGNDLVTVPWREVRFDEGEPSSKSLSTRPRSRLINGARLERGTVVEVPAETVRPGPKYQPVSSITLTGDRYEDYLRYRFGYETTPGWRVADLLKDRFEARRAPPLRPWPRPTYVWRAPHSSIP